MPLRSLPFPLSARLLVSRTRLFHTGTACKDSSQKPNYYETLQIPTNASPSEVKKSFYTLSKTHHPDRNPDDPNASSRFVQISEAYSILGTPAKRAKYDYDLDIHSPHSHSHHGPDHHGRPQGSYHSTNPAGGRAPSGLSRRRAQFHGPPPSFYRSGGWGAHSAKRKAASDSAEQAAQNTATGAAGAGEGGMGPGQTPFGHENDVPHFDREGHFRTHVNQQNRRQQRKRESGWGEIPMGHAPRSTLVNFLFVSGIIGLGVFIPGLIFERFSSKKSTR